MDAGEPAGGSLYLGELIDEHGLALAADFLSEYGVRLADVLFVWSPREVLALVEGLPDTSRTQAHLVGGEKWHEFWGWGSDRHILANLWDLIAAANTQPGKKVVKHPRPKPPPKKQEGQSVMALFGGIPMRTGG